MAKRLKAGAGPKVPGKGFVPSFEALELTLYIDECPLLLTCRFGADAGSFDPRPSTGDDRTLPRPSEEGGGSGVTPPPPGRGETPRHHGQEGAPKPPRSGEMGDPITISDESGDNPRSADVRAMGKGVESPLVVGRTPWPIGLHSIEENRKKDE